MVTKRKKSESLSDLKQIKKTVKENQMWIVFGIVIILITTNVDALVNMLEPEDKRTIIEEPGIEVQCYDIKFEKDKAMGLLPINKQSHLRPLATINQANKSISILKSKPKIKRSMWSRRAQEYEQKITSGKIYDLAEVVRDLNKGDDLMVDQSYSERQLFEKAYERILSEFQIVMKISHEETQKKLDKALKRNQYSQQVKVENKPEISPPEEVVTK